MLKTKLSLLASVAALVFSSQSVLAQYYSPYSSYGYGSSNNYSYPYNYNYRSNSTYSSPYSYSNSYGSYRSPYGYGTSNNTSSNYRYSSPYSSSSGSNYRYSSPYSSSSGYNYRQPYGSSSTYGNRAPYSYNQSSYYRQPYAYGYGYRPWYRKKKDDGFGDIFDDGPFSGGDFGEEFWPGDDSIWEDVLPIDGPWNRDWGQAPWNRDYADMYGDEGGPDKWFDFDDPKEGVAYMWEDFLYTPHALGTMPGGWDAPTVVVPNPIDVGDEFKDAAGDFPGEMKDFADGFTYGDRTITGSKPSNDAGSFGLGGKKKKDGINIAPKNRR